MRKPHMRGTGLALLALWAGPAPAQFGQKPGEAAVYLLTSKGDQTFVPVSAATANAPAAAAKFQVLDPFKLTPETVANYDLPMLKIIFMHREKDDVFQMIVQDDTGPFPHHVYLTTFKMFVIKGVRRDYGYSWEAPRDFTAGSYTTFLGYADLGPNLSMDGELHVLGWTNNDFKPPLVLTPDNFPGSTVPVGKTGTELVVDFAVLPPFVPWTPLRLKYPGAGWEDGIDYKFLEADTGRGCVAAQLRLKPGKRTTNFRIRGNTHFYVLHGPLTLTPAGGGQPIVLGSNTYVYIPDGYAFSLANPRSTLLGVGQP